MGATGHGNVRLEKKLGEGSFGIVYRVLYNGTRCALKIEKVKSSIRGEIRTLKCLRHPSIPAVINCGSYRGFSFMILPLYKISLVQILCNHPGFFTSRSVAAIGWNLLDVFEYMHLKGIVYRDIKPENVMIGFDSRIYLVDFGLCVPVRSAGTGSSPKLVGTVRYASINAHRGMSPSGRDDLESLVYVLIYLAKKHLPWCGMEDRDDVRIQKEKTGAKELCSQVENETLWIEFARRVRARDCAGQSDYEALKLILIGIIRLKPSRPGCSLLPGLLSCHRHACM